MSRAQFTAGDCAEQAGSALASNALADIFHAKKQAESVNALESALLGLQRLPHPGCAAAGFAVALIATIEHGLVRRSEFNDLPF